MLKFRDSFIGSLATLARSLDATMEEEAPKTDAEFVNQYVKKMEAQEKAAAEKKDPPAAKPAAKDDDEEEIDEEAADADTHTDAGAGDADDDDDDDEDAPDGADDDVEDDKAKPKAKKEEVDDEPDDSDTEFDRAAKSARLPTRLEDLPEEARPVVEKRLRDMEAGFNRVQQQATEFRQEQREFRADERYRAEHPAEFLASMLVKDPTLEEQVATLLEKLRDEDPSQREVAKVLEREHRAKAAKEIAADEEAEREQSEWAQTRSSEVETLARSACSKAGISFDRGVEAALAYEIRDLGDIKDARIKEIVEEMAQERGRSQRAVRREERKRVIQGKTAAKKNASPLRPGTGRAGGASKPAAKDLTLQEKMLATSERLFPGEP